MILALRAALSPSILCQTLRCGLPADMILQNNNQQDLPQIIQTDHILVSFKKKSGSITAVNWTFPKVTSSKNTIQSQKNPNTIDMQFLFSKAFTK
jgi:hypothetical protein